LIITFLLTDCHIIITFVLWQMSIPKKQGVIPYFGMSRIKSKDTKPKCWLYHYRYHLFQNYPVFPRMKQGFRKLNMPDSTQLLNLNIFYILNAPCIISLSLPEIPIFSARFSH
jgi:hypothetical protein